MSISSSELVWRKPQEVSNSSTNGGRMTSISSPSGVKNNIFPDVPEAERVAGSIVYRKVFIHVANDDDLTLIAPKVFVETRTPGDDNVTFVAGTQRNRQSALSGSEQRYGSGVLNAGVSAGSSTITVMVEDAALDFLKDGMKIRVSDKANINAAGNEEFVTINGVPSYAGNVATLNITPNLGNAYSATVTKVASVYEPGDVDAVATSFVKNSTAGTYNNGTYPVVTDYISTVEQSWTLTFTNSTTFNIVGDELGLVGTGNVSAGASPTNGNFSKPYFTLSAAGFGGTWQAGDTITFVTSPAAIPLWYRRAVPAGATSLSGNSVIVAVDGESA